MVVVALLFSTFGGDVHEAIAARDASIDLVRSIRCRYKGTRLNGELEEYEYWREGDVERVKLLRLSGNASAEEESLWTNAEVRSFNIPGTPGKGTLNELFRRGDARIAPRGGEGDVGGGFRGLRYLHVDCNVSRGRIKHLSDLKKLAKEAQWKGKDPITGCWVLFLSFDPGPATGEHSSETEIHLDPAHGFLIAKRIGRGKLRGGEKGKESKDGLINSSNESTVTEFYDFGGGLFWPKRCINTLALGTGEPIKLEYEFTHVEVNKPIPPNELRLKFPDDLLVMHLPSKNGRVPLEIYRDGELVRTINGFEEWKEFSENLKRQDEAAAARRWWLTASGAAAMLVVGGFFARRWWRSRE